MKIFFDSQIFILQRYGGVSRYFSMLISHLAQSTGNISVQRSLHQSEYLLDTNLGVNLDRYYASYGKLFLWTLIFYYNTVFFLRVWLYRPDVVHYTYYFHWKFPLPRSVTKIVTVHDMTHEIYDKIFRKKDITSPSKFRAVVHADHIICVSENSKKDLMEIFKIDCDKISVIHLASNISSDELIHPVKRTNKLLFVGGRPGYKNFLPALEALNKSRFIVDNYEISVIGAPFNQNELGCLADLNIRVSHAGSSEESLKEQYLSCVALIYPSLYEGFGLPLLEAMSLGCPVVCSDSSSLPEIAGNAAIYFSNQNMQELPLALESLLTKGKKLDELRHFGFLRAQSFSWSICASKTLALYQKLKK